MSAAVLGFAVALAQLALAVALALATMRMIRGPRAQDRVLALDTLYVTAMLLLVTLGMLAGLLMLFLRLIPAGAHPPRADWRWGLGLFWPLMLMTPPSWPLMPPIVVAFPVFGL